MDFNKGDLIKINPDLFDKDDLAEMFGELGYPGLLKFLTFEVQGITKDPQGDGYDCIITNPDELLNHLEGSKRIECGGSWFILMKDAVRASTKVTMDYEILTKTMDEFHPDVILDSLKKERAKLRSMGKLKSHKEMVENWRKQRVVKGQLKPTMPQDKDLVAPTTGVTEVGLIKQGLKFEVPNSMLPKNDTEEEVNKFKYYLSSLLKKYRNNLKQKDQKAIKTIEFFGTNISLVGGVHTKAQEPINAWKKFIINAFEIEKKPISNKDNYVGIELEIIYSGNVKRLKELMADNRLHKNVTIHRDESVRPCHNSGYQGLELTVLCTENELSRVLTGLENVFSDPDIDAYTNRSCSLHVHLDMRRRDHKLAFKNLVRVQDLLRGAQPKGRVNNIHCLPNKSDTFKVINDRGDRFDRYWVVNPNSYEKYTTLEVRVHEGTLVGQDIFNWIKFLTAIADYTGTIKEEKYKLASDLISQGIKIPAESLSYMDSRITKFKSLGA